MKKISFFKPMADKAYILNELWLPKNKIREERIKASLSFLTFGYKGEEEPIVLWRETETHLIVPREYIKEENYGKWQFPFIDLRPKSFPHVDFQTTFKPRNNIQEEAYTSMLQADNGILNLACGYGKTAISLGIIAALKMPTMIVVHTTTLVNQWVEQINNFLKFDGEIGIFQQDRQELMRPIVVAMIHSLANKSQELPVSLLKRFGVVIYDEIHHLAAPVFSLTAPLFWGKRFGLTATEERDDRRESVYFYHVGRILYTHKKQHLTPKTYFVSTGVNMQPDDPNRPHDLAIAREHFLDRSGEYHIGKIRQWLGTLDRRNALIIRLVKDCVKAGRRILIVGHSLQILRTIHEAIPESALCIGSIHQDARYEALQSSQVVTATLQIAQEGLDQPLLDTLVVLTPTSSKNIVEQVVGRILRVHPDKKEPKVFVIADLGVIRISSSLIQMRRHLRTLGYPYEQVPEYTPNITK